MKIEIEEDIKELTSNVDGWLSDKEGVVLYELAKNCTGKGVIVEIGSWKGKSTIWLGKGSITSNRVKIYSIDPHTGSSEHNLWYGKVWTFEEFKKNIKSAAIEDLVIPIVKTSEDAAKNFNEPVELIFIDAAHEYEFVKLDFELWFPKVIDGGIMAFHDIIEGSGPKKVVEKIVIKSKNFRNVKIIDTILFAQKVQQNTLIDRIKNRCVYLLKNIYDFAGKMPKPIRIIGKKILQ